MSSRELILGRIRGALVDLEASSATEIPRGYELTLPLERSAIVARFAKRVADYRAEVVEAPPSRLAATLAEVLAGHAATRVGAPTGLDPGWLAEVAVVADEGLSTRELDELDGVVTGCALGIAETGTVVLDGGPRSGRRALTLVPDLHVCVVVESDIVGTVPEAMDALADRGLQTSPITFVSGPSATSDIEMQRIEGVHGPRTLVVVIVLDESPSTA